MKHAAQAWVLTVEASGDQGALGVLTVCGDGTSLEPESYEFGGSLRSIFRELETVLDATMCTFWDVAEGLIPAGQMHLR